MVACRHIVLSASKDSTVRLWHFNHHTANEHHHHHMQANLANKHSAIDKPASTFSGGHQLSVTGLAMLNGLDFSGKVEEKIELKNI
jgi:hypothetical protein